MKKGAAIECRPCRNVNVNKVLLCLFVALVPVADENERRPVKRRTVFLAGDHS